MPKPKLIDLGKFSKKFFKALEGMREISEIYEEEPQEQKKSPKAKILTK